MDGLEVARRIRKEPFGSGVVLVALTGYCQPEDRRRSMEVGFQHHLAKPVTFGVIQNLISEIQPPPF
jgi:CheY-like chemotaxis protein